MQGYKVTLPGRIYTRSGSNQTSWSIKNSQYEIAGQYSLTGNATAYAMWDNLSSVVDQYFPIHHQYSTKEQYSIKMSDNIDTINIHGTGENGTNGIEQQIQYCKIAPGIKTIGDACFYGCSKLEYVYLPETCRTIQNSAFYNCSKLMNINCIGNNAYSMLYIGDHAFDGCDSLNDVNINLSGSNRSTGVGSYAFANCKNLKRVTWTNSSFLSEHMFDNCTSLTELSLNHYTSYVYPFALANIPNLTSITIPSNIWQMSEGMFFGDSKLKELTIEDTSEKQSYMNELGDGVFSGCNSLTAITLPKSINRVQCIGDNFLSGSNIQQITFNGLSDDQFYIKKQISVDDFSGYKTGVMYHTYTDVVKVYNIAMKYNVPIVMLATNDCVDIEGDPDRYYVKQGNVTYYSCGNCSNWYNTTEKKAKFQNFMKNSGYFFVVGGRGRYGHAKGDYSVNKKGYYTTSYGRTYDAGKANDFVCSKWDFSKGDNYPVMILQWKKPDSTTITKYINGVYAWCRDKADGDKDKYPDVIINKINSTFNGYEAPTKEEAKKYEFITNTDIGTFGSPLSYVTYISNSGQRYICTNQTIVHDVNVHVDVETKDNFQYGTWYYNSEQLREYADTYGIPVFVEYSDVGCTPCQYFRKNVFNNSTFQNWVKKQNCLFCRVEVESQSWWTDKANHPQAYYVDNVWAKQSPNYKNQGIPIFMWYWKKPGEDTPQVWDISSYHYNPEAIGAKPPVSLNELMEITETKFKLYEKDDRFVRFDEIVALYNSAGDKVIGRKYPNQENDTNGRYFITNTEKKEIKAYSTTFSIKDCPIYTSLSVGQIVSIPPATYQYYDPDDSEQYHIDSYGVIFRVNALSVVEYMYNFENKYEQEKEDDGDDKYKFGQWYTLTNSDSADTFKDMYKTAEDKSYHMIMNVLLSGDEESESFLENVIDNQNFQKWMSDTYGTNDEDEEIKYHYLFLNIISSNAPATGAIKEFESFINEENRMGKLLRYPDGQKMEKLISPPSLFVYEVCKNCVSNPKPLSNAIFVDCTTSLLDSSGNVVDYETYEKMIQGAVNYESINVFNI